MMMGANAGHLNRRKQARGGCHTWSSPPDLRRLKAACKYDTPPRPSGPGERPTIDSRESVMVVSARVAWEDSEEDSEEEEEEGWTQQELANLSQWEGASERPPATVEDSDASTEQDAPGSMESPPGARRCGLDPLCMH